MCHLEKQNLEAMTIAALFSLPVHKYVYGHKGVCDKLQTRLICVPCIR